MNRTRSIAIAALVTSVGAVSFLAQRAKADDGPGFGCGFAYDSLELELQNVFIDGVKQESAPDYTRYRLLVAANQGPNISLWVAEAESPPEPFIYEQFRHVDQ